MEITYQSGDTALLPCDISNTNPVDRVTLLLWYKEDNLGTKGSPIYRIDARTNQDLVIGQSRVPILDWVNEKVIGRNRVSFDTQLSPASLKIRNISEADSGLYRCRVDFTTSQTRTERINLKVIVRPGKPHIFDDTGTVRDIFAGPYLEGNDIHLSCRVYGGKPPPRVVWFKNFQILSEQYIQEEDPFTKELVTYNNLTLHAVPRSDLHANITCEATNYNNSVQQKTITLDMNFLPLKMEVLNKESELQAGIKQTFTCKAYGSRPPAILTWWMGNQRLDGEVYSPVPTDGTTSTSTISIVPTEADTNKTLTCKAENREIRQGILKESWDLDILYPPRITLELSSMLEEQDVAEGNDVFFVCKISSNPPINRMVEWYHNGKLLKQIQKKGIIMNSSGTNLVLQEVKKEANGNYTCSANNGIPHSGHTVYSKPFNLDVKYLPVCVPEGVKVYGVAKEENVRIRCQVAANPSNLTFRWTFNNSAEIKHVSQNKFQSNGTVSLFSYKPERELDYGTLMCWSRNSIGEQQKPCVFHIIAAGKPDPVKNCSISNVTSNSFQISCSPGFNGGLPQNFTIEVIENETLESPVFLQIKEKPIFSVLNLKESTEYRVYVAPVNMKGSGQPQSSQGTIVKTHAEARPVITNPEGNHDTKEGMNPVLVLIFGGATGLFIILLTITLAVKIRCSRSRNISRENSKVVVTTITDIEFNEDHHNDRLPLSLAVPEETEHGGEVAFKPGNSYIDDSFPTSNPSDEDTSAYIKRHAQGRFHQHQPNFHYLMYPQTEQTQPNNSYCTLRKPHSNPISVQFTDSSRIDHQLPSEFTGKPCGKAPTGLDPQGADVVDFCEKQRAGFMYGTLRHNRGKQDFCSSSYSGNPGFPGNGVEETSVTQPPQIHGCLVPPPPMFEEGNLNIKTPLIAKKCGKSEKKDKMESRV